MTLVLHWGCTRIFFSFFNAVVVKDLTERAYQPTIWLIFSKNFMKVKKFWPRGEGRAFLAPLPHPLPRIRSVNAMCEGTWYKNRVVKVSLGGSHLAPARSQWPMNSLVCIGFPTNSGGQGARGRAGASWEQAGASWSELEQAGVRQVSRMLY